MSLVHTMTQVDLMTHRLTSAAQISTSGRYEADLARFKEDLFGMMKTKLGVDMGNSRLYQKPYSAKFYLVSYPIGCRFPDFVKFRGDDNRTTWEHISHYIVQLGEAGFRDALRIRLFSLSLTGTAFS